MIESRPAPRHAPLSLASRLSSHPSTGTSTPTQPTSHQPRAPKLLKRDVKAKLDPSQPRANRQPSGRTRLIGNALSSIKGVAHRTNASKLKRVKPPRTETAIDILRRLLEARYDPATSFLDLSNLAADNILRDGGIAPPGEKGAPTKTASAIWILCQEKYPNIQSISLANNNLSNLQPMSIGVLVSTLPNLINISLAGNRLRSFSDLNSFSTTVGGTSDPSTSSKSGLNNLREINLKGNPLQTNVGKDFKKLQEYQMEACRRFPSLEILDGELLNPEIKSQISLLSDTSTFSKPMDVTNPIGPEPSLPLPIKAAFFDDESTSTVISSFFSKFFTAHDQDRNLLVDVYHNQASFSISGSFSIPVRAKCAGLNKNSKEMPSQEVPALHEYMDIDRNFEKVKGSKLGDRISYGPAEIIKHLKLIPRTKHSIEESQKFIVDGWQMPSLTGGSDERVIYCTIHGEFQELPSLTFRSFDRTFMLGPASPASAATLKGWPCVILNDQLTIRSYSSPSAWQLNTTSLTVEQEKMIQQLREVTKLNPELALDCLVQNSWQLNKALENVELLKVTGGLPPNAFDTT